MCAVVGGSFPTFLFQLPLLLLGSEIPSAFCLRKTLCCHPCTGSGRELEKGDCGLSFSPCLGSASELEEEAGSLSSCISQCLALGSRPVRAVIVAYDRRGALSRSVPEARRPGNLAPFVSLIVNRDLVSSPDQRSSWGCDL